MVMLCGLIAGAGIGRRMHSDTPKQYLQLADRTVMEHSIAALDAVPNLSNLVVVLHHEDEYWKAISLKTKTPVKAVVGGDSRADSVLAGLVSIIESHGTDVWVLGHDAARPLVKSADINRLVASVSAENSTGSILAVPATDTLKQIDQEGNIVNTIDRSVVWAAQTPQIFRSGQLKLAIEESLRKGMSITDEASAMENVGFSPSVISGSRDNIKITTPEDLAFCEYHLTQAEPGSGD